jgi:hypothetical protein
MTNIGEIFIFKHLPFVVLQAVLQAYPKRKDFYDRAIFRRKLNLLGNFLPLSSSTVSEATVYAEKSTI